MGIYTQQMTIDYEVSNCLFSLHEMLNSIFMKKKKKK